MYIWACNGIKSQNTLKSDMVDENLFIIMIIMSCFVGLLTLFKLYKGYKERNGDESGFAWEHKNLADNRQVIED